MQQVNLYLPEFQPRRVWLSLPQMLAATVAAAALLVILALFSAAHTRQLTSTLDTERQQLQALQERVAALTAELPARRGLNIEEQLAQLRADVARREQILQLITRQNLGNAEGFSEQLVSLSRHVPEDLALSGFSLQSGGQYAELAGRVRAPEVVPRYLERLRTDQSFFSVGFGVLEVAREPDDTGPGLRFTVERAENDNTAGVRRQ